jgi:hypothetical protein
MPLKVSKDFVVNSFSNGGILGKEKNYTMNLERLIRFSRKTFIGSSVADKRALHHALKPTGSLGTGIDPVVTPVASPGDRQYREIIRPAAMASVDVETVGSRL